jgi:hypothetical protein
MFSAASTIVDQAKHDKELRQNQADSKSSRNCPTPEHRQIVRISSVFRKKREHKTHRANQENPIKRI